MDVSRSHKAIIVCPLRVLMLDQVSRWNKREVKSFATLSNHLDDEDMKDLDEGQWTLLFITPESLKEKKWRDCIKKNASTIDIIALDEVHCMVDWGQSFRPDYKDVVRTRAIVRQAAILAVTATVTQPMVDEIKTTLRLSDSEMVDIVAVPNRSNIFVEIDPDRQVDVSKLQWYTDLLKEKGRDTPKCIIFCRQQQQMLDLFYELSEEVGDDLYWTGSAGEPGDGLIEMFYGQVDHKTEDLLPKAFMKSDSPCRCVVATIAFGLGLQVDDVRYIIHWGPATDMLSYWQEIGRCGRDGQPSKAIMYLPKHSTHKDRINPDVLDMIDKGSSNCIRKAILMSLKLKQVQSESIDACCGGELCCSYCLSVTTTDSALQESE